MATRGPPPPDSHRERRDSLDLVGPEVAFATVRSRRDPGGSRGNRAASLGFPRRRVLVTPSAALGFWKSQYVYSWGLSLDAGSGVGISAASLVGEAQRHWEKPTD